MKFRDSRNVTPIPRWGRQTLVSFPDRIFRAREK